MRWLNSKRVTRDSGWGDLRPQALTIHETYQMNDMVKGCLACLGPITGNGQVGVRWHFRAGAGSDDEHV